MTQSIVISTVEISGLASPLYPSGAVNKKYVDAISGNLDSRIDALGGFEPEDYITSANAIIRFKPSSGIWTFASAQTLSGQLLNLHTARDLNFWDSHNWNNSGIIWNESLNKWNPKPSGGAGGATTLDALTDVTISTPRSGQILQYNQDSAQWVNRFAPMTFDIANVVLYSGQNINLARFKCPTGKSAYIWQSAACNSGGASKSGLCIQMISGNSQLGTFGSIYKTSCNILQMGYPLAKSPIDSNIEIRFMYSGLNSYGQQATQLHYGSAFMQISVY